MPLDKAKLAKIMALTTSDSGGEALAAVWMANKLLAAEKLTWEEVLASTPPAVRISIQRQPYTAEENWSPVHLRDKVMIDLMFRIIYTQPRGEESFWQWLDDVHEKFRRYGQLTQGQYTALRKSYQRVVRATA